MTDDAPANPPDSRPTPDWWMRLASSACLIVLVRSFIWGDTPTMTIAGLLNLFIIAVDRRLNRIEEQLIRGDRL